MKTTKNQVTTPGAKNGHANPEKHDPVETYLSAVPEPARSTLQSMRAHIRTLLPPEATEVISYGMPTFKHKGAVVGYAAFDRHCSLFPYSAALLAEYAEDLKDYSTSKGTIRFSPDQPLPEALVAKIVKARLATNEAKKPAPKRAPARKS